MPNHAERLGNGAIQKLVSYKLQDSLPEVYNDKVGYWLYDFWPDLPWSEDGQREAVTVMRAHPSYKDICAWFATRYSFDFDAELQHAFDPPE